MITRIRDKWRTPLWQSLLVGMVLFCCPGMFNAINGMGAGGSAAANTALVAKANSALYACFAVVGLFSGSIINTVGPRICLALGGIGYAVYIGSLWSLDRSGPQAFVIAAGAILGITAALLWAAQGVVVMSYPLEAERSRHFAYQWSLLGVGAAIGGLIPLAQSVRTGTTDAVSTSSYIAFFIIVVFGIGLSLLLAKPTDVHRNDGTPVQVESSPPFKDEIVSILKLVTDKNILLLTPAFLASNWFYAYQFGMNGFYFSLRARSLNSMMYWLTQVVGTFAISGILDLKNVRRRTRGLIGLAVVTAFVVATWCGGVAFQLTFTRETPAPNKDWSDAGWGGPFVLYFMYGMADAMFQSYCYWIMSACTNDPQRLARYAGWYKGIQSAGAALSFGINACEIPFIAELGVCFALQVGSIPLILLVALGVTDTNYGLEDTVVPPKDLVQAAGKAAALVYHQEHEEESAGSKEKVGDVDEYAVAVPA